MGYRRRKECPLALVPTSSRQGLSAHAHHTRGEADASRFRRTGCTRADVDNRTTESTGRHPPPTHPRQAGSTHPPTHPPIYGPRPAVSAAGFCRILSVRPTLSSTERQRRRSVVRQRRRRRQPGAHTVENRPEHRPSRFRGRTRTPAVGVPVGPADVFQSTVRAIQLWRRTYVTKATRS